MVVTPKKSNIPTILTTGGVAIATAVGSILLYTWKGGAASAQVATKTELQTSIAGEVQRADATYARKDVVETENKWVRETLTRIETGLNEISRRLPNERPHP